MAKSLPSVVSQTVNRYQHRIGHVVITVAVANRAPRHVARRYFIVGTKQDAWLSEAQFRTLVICLYMLYLTILSLEQPV